MSNESSVVSSERVLTSDFWLRTSDLLLPTSYFLHYLATKTKLLMKRSIVTLLSFVLVLGVSGQALESQDSSKPVKSFTPSYAVKWNPASLYFGKIGLFGE